MLFGNQGGRASTFEFYDAHKATVFDFGVAKKRKWIKKLDKDTSVQFHLGDDVHSVYQKLVAGVGLPMTSSSGEVKSQTNVKLKTTTKSS